jgi:hypothetical protein
VSEAGIQLLRALLARTEEKQHAHRSQYRPLRWRRRRDPHRCYMQFVYTRPRCQS